jgi:hypothetical protein
VQQPAVQTDVLAAERPVRDRGAGTGGRGTAGGGTLIDAGHLDGSTWDGVIRHPAARQL